MSPKVEVEVIKIHKKVKTTYSSTVYGTRKVTVDTNSIACDSAVQEHLYRWKHAEQCSSYRTGS